MWPLRRHETMKMAKIRVAPEHDPEADEGTACQVSQHAVSSYPSEKVAFTVGSGSSLPATYATPMVGVDSRHPPNRVGLLPASCRPWPQGRTSGPDQRQLDGSYFEQVRPRFWGRMIPPWRAA